MTKSLLGSEGISEVSNRGGWPTVSTFAFGTLCRRWMGLFVPGRRVVNLII